MKHYKLSKKDNLIRFQYGFMLGMLAGAAITLTVWVLTPKPVNNGPYKTNTEAHVIYGENCGSIK